MNGWQLSFLPGLGRLQGTIQNTDFIQTLLETDCGLAENLSLPEAEPISWVSSGVSPGVSQEDYPWSRPAKWGLRVPSTFYEQSCAQPSQLLRQGCLSQVDLSLAVLERFQKGGGNCQPPSAQHNVLGESGLVSFQWGESCRLPARPREKIPGGETLACLPQGPT